MSEPKRNDTRRPPPESRIPGRHPKLLGAAILAAIGLLLLHTAPGRSQRDQPPAQPGGAPQPSVVSPSLTTTYANFCKVHVTPEELILDFGLNTSAVANPKEPVKLTSRLVMNYYTAKRLAGALQRVIQEYEKTYGNIELDFRKRAQPGKRPAGPDTE
jgi:hypothetical protein